MKLATFSDDEGLRIGRVDGDRVLDLAKAAPDLPRSMMAFLGLGRQAMARVAALPTAEDAVSLDRVRLHAPIPQPPKFLAIGLNFHSHVAEAKDVMAPAQAQVWFNKQVTCVSGPRDPILLPAASSRLDYEGELGFVIGSECHKVGPDEARAAIAGYVVVNDVSVRDWQIASPTMTLGKSYPSHGPFGPWLTTADAVADPQNLRIRTWVNGELRQDASTRDMVHSCIEQVVHLSERCRLLPGDVIATGTPAGVGALMDPRRFLVAGDIVRVEVEGLGCLEQRVVAEPAATLRSAGDPERGRSSHG